MAASTPHDALFKSCLSKPLLAREFLEIYLPAHIRCHCDFTNLQVEPSSFVDKTLRQYHSDILYSMKIAGEDAYIFVLLEHQRQADKMMAFRLLHYQVLLMKRHYDRYAKLPIVVPMVFYQGELSPYPYSLALADCFENSQLAQEVMFKDFSLIDLSIIPDDEIKSHRNIALFELVQKHIVTRDILHLLHEMKAILLKKDTPEPVVEDVIKYLLITQEKENYQVINEILGQSEVPLGDKAMTTIAEYLIEQGLEQGLERGFEQGRKEEAYAIAKKMLGMGLDIPLVQKATGLSNEEMQRLKHNLR